MSVHDKLPLDWCLVFQRSVFLLRDTWLATYIGCHRMLPLSVQLLLIVSCPPLSTLLAPAQELARQTKLLFAKVGQG